MEQNVNTIDLDYKETPKVSLGIKIIAIILFFTFIPMYEFLTQFKPQLIYVSCCSCIGS